MTMELINLSTKFLERVQGLCIHRCICKVLFSISLWNVLWLHILVYPFYLLPITCLLWGGSIACKPEILDTCDEVNTIVRCCVRVCSWQVCRKEFQHFPELQSWGNSTTFSTAFYRMKVAANIIIHDPSCAINHEVQMGSPNVILGVDLQCEPDSWDAQPRLLYCPTDLPHGNETLLTSSHFLHS
jgi:hypothetical protein